MVFALRESGGLFIWQDAVFAAGGQDVHPIVVFGSGK